MDNETDQFIGEPIQIINYKNLESGKFGLIKKIVDKQIN